MTINASAPATTTAWVVKFDPIDRSYSSTGGHTWDYVQANAEQFYDTFLATHGQHDRVRLFEVDEVPTGLTNDEVTDWMDNYLESNAHEMMPLRDNHRYEIRDVDPSDNDRGEGCMFFNVHRPDQTGHEEDDVEFIVHQSLRDTPTINVEIGGHFDEEHAPGVGRLVIHLNDSVIYTSDPEYLSKTERHDLRVVLEDLLAQL